MDLISKKDLLALTGISYGQLYRWKRERLIPEEWFIKQSSYTGQETFFPRQKILSRIQTILDAKDKYSLEELSRILSPQQAPEGFCSAEELRAMGELSPEVLALVEARYGRESYDFSDVVLYAAVSQAQRALDPSPEALGGLLGRAASAAKPLSVGTDLTMTVFRAGEDDHVLFFKTAAPLSLDSDLTVLGSWDLGGMAEQIRLNYQSRRK